MKDVFSMQDLKIIIMSVDVLNKKSVNLSMQRD